MKRVDPLHFHNDAKVKRSTVLQALARMVGETIEIASGLDEHMEADLVLQAGPASRIVRQVLGEIPWWVGFDGITCIGPREPREISEPHELLSFDPREKAAVLAADDGATLVPATQGGSARRRQVDQSEAAVEVPRPSAAASSLSRLAQPVSASRSTRIV